MLDALAVRRAADILIAWSAVRAAGVRMLAAVILFAGVALFGSTTAVLDCGGNAKDGSI